MANNKYITVDLLSRNNDKIKEELNKKINIQQGNDNNGKLLGVGSDGNVTLVEKPDSVKISTETGNKIEQKSDGIYVADTTIAISTTDGNIISQKSDGLFAEDSITEILVDGVAVDITDKKVNLEGFIKRSVNNLENYYLKSDTYTKDEVDTLISSMSTLTIKKATELPTDEINTTTIYLLPKRTEGTQNIYTEYINIDGTSNGWEIIGDTEIDLSDYAKIEYIDEKIKTKADKISEADIKENQILIDDGNGNIKGGNVTINDIPPVWTGTKAEWEKADKLSINEKTIINITDDYMENSNNGNVDLSDYYTKAEIDEKITDVEVYAEAANAATENHIQDTNVHINSADRERWELAAEQGGDAVNQLNLVTQDIENLQKTAFILEKRGTVPAGETATITNLKGPGYYLLSLRNISIPPMGLFLVMVNVDHYDLFPIFKDIKYANVTQTNAYELSITVDSDSSGITYDLYKWDI